MARSKIFTALLEESEKISKEGGNILNKVVPINKQKTLEKIPKTNKLYQAEGTGQGQDKNRTETGQEQYKSRIKTGQEQGRDRTGTRQEQYRDSIGTEQGQYRDSIEPIQKQYSNNIEKINNNKITLPKKQLQIYMWFINRGFKGIFNKPVIQKETKIAYTTIRKAIRKFEALQLMKISYNNSLKYYEYIINTQKNVNRNIIKIGTVSGQYQDSIGIGQGREQEQDRDRTETGLNNSSSSYIYKTTTTEKTEQDRDRTRIEFFKEIQTILNQNPELGYWKQKSLTAKQIAEWIKTANCNLDMMIQYLCYCRFEMLDLNFEKSKPIENVFNWFFRILERTGGYPKPKGYKSFQEKKIETERQSVKQKEKEAREIREIYECKVKAEQDKKFWNMMNDPEGNFYKKCFENLNNFQKNRSTGKSFEMSMRGVFNKIILEG